MAKKLRVVKAPTNNRELIALDVMARDPVTGEFYVKRIPAGNPRDVGRARIERALTDIRSELKNILPVRGIPDDAESRFSFFREWVDAIDDSEIADDAEAGRALLYIAYAIAHAFELGRDAGRGPLERKLHRRRMDSRKGALENANKRSELWNPVAQEILDDPANGRATDETLTDKIFAALDKKNLKRARRTVFNYVRKHRKRRTAQ